MYMNILGVCIFLGLKGNNPKALFVFLEFIFDKAAKVSSSLSV